MNLRVHSKACFGCTRDVANRLGNRHGRDEAQCMSLRRIAWGDAEIAVTAACAADDLAFLCCLQHEIDVDGLVREHYRALCVTLDHSSVKQRMHVSMYGLYVSPHATSNLTNR